MICHQNRVHSVHVHQYRSHGIEWSCSPHALDWSTAPAPMTQHVGRGRGTGNSKSTVPEARFPPGETTSRPLPKCLTSSESYTPDIQERRTTGWTWRRAMASSEGFAQQHTSLEKITRYHRAKRNSTGGFRREIHGRVGGRLRTRMSMWRQPRGRAVLPTKSAEPTYGTSLMGELNVLIVL